MSLDKEPTLFRSSAVRGFGGQTPEIVEDGGNFKAGMIKNFSVIAVGEALGHGMWIDQEFADSVGEALAREGLALFSEMCWHFVEMTSWRVLRTTWRIFPRWLVDISSMSLSICFPDSSFVHRQMLPDLL